MDIHDILVVFLVPWLAALSWVVWQFKGELAEVKQWLTQIDTKLNIMFKSDDEETRRVFHSVSDKKK
jgi:hypothetical protein